MSNTTTEPETTEAETPDYLNNAFMYLLHGALELHTQGEPFRARQLMYVALNMALAEASMNDFDHAEWARHKLTTWLITAGEDYDPADTAALIGVAHEMANTANTLSDMLAPVIERYELQSVPVHYMGPAIEDTPREPYGSSKN